MKSLSLVAVILYFFLTHKLNNYHLPDGENPVGRVTQQLQPYSRNGNLLSYIMKYCSKCKKGFKWLKVKDYAEKMDDTTKKDNSLSLSQNCSFIILQVYDKFLAQIDLYYAETTDNLSKFSVIILIHGLASHCDGYSVIARYLAQHGHIVFVPEHIENIRNIYLTNEENREYRKLQLQDRQLLFNYWVQIQIIVQIFTLRINNMQTFQISLQFGIVKADFIAFQQMFMKFF
ncbi:unnamed protein product [Paramecium primaurelia]|uniref:1-alkyl-2-acetylglycerophosphocholine esterase n=1 Tax=Paramecium primaurelia TaxID=5886 RepID=A0A8S1P7E0_PARPR|nr:unnamed protein product [Paramecium primaurelia]